MTWFEIAVAGGLAVSMVEVARWLLRTRGLSEGTCATLAAFGSSALMTVVSSGIALATAHPASEAAPFAATYFAIAVVYSVLQYMVRGTIEHERRPRRPPRNMPASPDVPEAIAARPVPRASGSGLTTHALREDAGCVGGMLLRLAFLVLAVGAVSRIWSCAFPGTDERDAEVADVARDECEDVVAPLEARIEALELEMSELREESRRLRSDLEWHEDDNEGHR